MERQNLVFRNSLYKDAENSKRRRCSLDRKFDKALASRLRKAPWKSVAVETTALTPQALPIKMDEVKRFKGFDPTPRLRILTVLFPNNSGKFEKHAIDFDRLTQSDRADYAQASITGMVVGHNFDFDLYWLWFQTDRTVFPTAIFDTMLMARAIAPEWIVHAAQWATDEKHPRHAWAMKLFNAKNSSWALDDVTFITQGIVLDKTYQKPINWAAPYLDRERYDYCVGDVDSSLKIACELLGLPAALDPKQPNVLVESYANLKVEHPEYRLDFIESQFLDIVLTRDKPKILCYPAAGNAEVT